MRVSVLPLLMVMMVTAGVAQELVHDAPMDGVRIPVELRNTIKAEKVHRGDPVRFHMAEAILAGHGLVIPANANVFGHIVSAGGTGEGQRSHISIIVDRAEWKGNVVSLHAFVSGFAFRQQPAELNCDVNRDLPRFGSRDTMFSDNNPIATMVGKCDETDRVRHASEDTRRKALSEIKLYQSVRGSNTELVSKKNIHLPGGLVMIFKNDTASTEPDKERDGQ